MLQKNGVFTLIFSLAFLTCWSQTATSIKAKISDAASQKVLLVYRLGDKQYISDSADADAAGNITFSYTQPKEHGVYLLTFPEQKNAYIEFVLSADQDFSFQSTVSNPVSAVFTGSGENTLFYSYMKGLADLRDKSDKLNTRLAQFKEQGQQDSIAEIQKRFEELNSQYQSFTRQFMKEHPDAFVSKLLGYQLRPEIPKTVKGDTERYRYYKSHLMDHVDWTFGAIVRTAALDALLKEYIDQLTVQSYDSLIVGCDFILSKAKANNDIFRYCLTELLNKFARSKVPFQEEVYVHLVDKYYISGQAFWMAAEENREQLELIKKSAEKFRSSLCGSDAYNFSLPNASGKQIELKKLTDNYIVLFFWWSNEKNSLLALQELGKMADLMKLKGMKPVGIPMASDKERWKTEIDALEVEGMIHLWPGSKEEYNSITAKYYAQYYPNFFVLDKDRKILFKCYSTESLKNYISTLPNK